MPIEIFERLHEERGSSVIALLGVLCVFHFTQQRIHLVDRQLPVLTLLGPTAVGPNNVSTGICLTPC